MVHKKFVIGNQPAVYDPKEFIKLCRQAGAPNIFNHILQAITDDRHSNKWQDLNSVRVVSIIYTMCYCRSQMCNVMQVDHTMYLNFKQDDPGRNRYRVSPRPHMQS